MYSYNEFRRISNERKVKLEAEKVERERKEMLRLLGMAQPYISAFENYLDCETTTISDIMFTTAFRVAGLSPLNNEKVANAIVSYFNELGWGVMVTRCNSPDPEVEYQIRFNGSDE